MTQVRRLGPDDAEAFQDLRLRGLREAPQAFAEHSEEFARIPRERHAQRLEDAPGNAIALGAFREDRLIGLGGLFSRADRRNIAHRFEVWGMYVTPEHRRNGVGQAILQALIEHARSIPRASLVTLTVTANQVPARRLYERAGFLEWGRLPRAYRIDGTYHDEIHMALNLDDSPLDVTT